MEEKRNNKIACIEEVAYLKWVLLTDNKLLKFKINE